MSQKSENQPYEQRSLLTKITLAAFISFGLSSWLTASGLMQKAVEAGVATTEGMSTAVMSAVVAASLLGVSTMSLFGIALRARHSQRWQVVGLALALLPFILCISTYYAVIGNAGGASLVYDMRDTSKEWAQYYDEALADASAAQSAHAALLPLQSSICGLAESERSGGLLTGSRGGGAVAAAYGSGCDSVTTILETLNDTIIRTEERRAESVTILKTLQDIPKDTAQSVFERQAAFREQTTLLQDILAKSGAEKVSSRLSAQLDILEASIATLGTQDSAFGQKQDQAVQNLKASLGLVSEAVSGLLDQDKTAVLQAPDDLLDTGEAVFVYWQKNLPQVLLAVMVDLSSLYFLGLLVVSRAAASRNPEPEISTQTQTSEGA